MTIDEAIAFCHEKSNNIKLKAEPEVFIQLAEWLEELKELKKSAPNRRFYTIGYKEGYNKAIDDFVEELKDYFVIPHDVRVVEMNAEQLKEGGKNGRNGNK